MTEGSRQDQRRSSVSDCASSRAPMTPAHQTRSREAAQAHRARPPSVHSGSSGSQSRNEGPAHPSSRPVHGPFTAPLLGRVPAMMPHHSMPLPNATSGQLPTARHPSANGQAGPAGHSGRQDHHQHQRQRRASMSAGVDGPRHRASHSAGASLQSAHRAAFTPDVPFTPTAGRGPHQHHQHSPRQHHPHPHLHPHDVAAMQQAQQHARMQQQYQQQHRHMMPGRQMMPMHGMIPMVPMTRQDLHGRMKRSYQGAMPFMPALAPMMAGGMPHGAGGRMTGPHLWMQVHYMQQMMMRRLAKMRAYRKQRAAAAAAAAKTRVKRVPSSGSSTDEHSPTGVASDAEKALLARLAALNQSFSAMVRQPDAAQPESLRRILNDAAADLGVDLNDDRTRQTMVEMSQNGAAAAAAAAAAVAREQHGDAQARAPESAGVLAGPGGHDDDTEWARELSELRAVAELLESPSPEKAASQDLGRTASAGNTASPPHAAAAGDAARSRSPHEGQYGDAVWDAPESLSRRRSVDAPAAPAADDDASCTPKSAGAVLELREPASLSIARKGSLSDSELGASSLRKNSYLSDLPNSAGSDASLWEAVLDANLFQSGILDGPLDAETTQCESRASMADMVPDSASTAASAEAREEQHGAEGGRGPRSGAKHRSIKALSPSDTLDPRRCFSDGVPVHLLADQEAYSPTALNSLLVTPVLADTASEFDLDVAALVDSVAPADGTQEDPEAGARSTRKYAQSGANGEGIDSSLESISYAAPMTVIDHYLSGGV